MHILSHRKRPHLAFKTPSAYYRNLHGKVDETFNDHRRVNAPVQRIKGFCNLRILADHPLALTVVTPTHRLHHHRQTNIVNRRHRLLNTPDDPILRNRDAQTRQRVLLNLAVLTDPQHRRRRIHRLQLRNHLNRRRIHILELVRNHIRPLRQLPRRIQIVIRRSDVMVRDLRSRAIATRIQRNRTITHCTRRHGQHPTQLPTAEYPDRRTRSHPSPPTHPHQHTSPPKPPRSRPPDAPPTAPAHLHHASQ